MRFSFWSGLILLEDIIVLKAVIFNFSSKKNNNNELVMGLLSFHLKTFQSILAIGGFLVA